MAQKIPKKIKEDIFLYINELKSEMIIDKVVIFGSYAKGKFTDKSDIDIAIVSDFFSKKGQNNSFLFRKLWNVKNSNIDPIGYSNEEYISDTPSPLLSEIHKTGYVLNM